MPGQRKAIVIHSPHSGRAPQLTEALAHLKGAGIEIVDDISIAELDKMPAQGPAWREKGIELAIAAGGDGLIGGVISHIAESGPLLGILPLGTSNDTARSLLIPQEIGAAVDIIAQGHTQEIDIGRALPAEQAPHPASRHQHGPVLEQVPPTRASYFAHTLTVGLNVQFARLATSADMRERFGPMTYPVAALDMLMNHEPLEVRLHFDGLDCTSTRTTVAECEQAQPELKCRALQVAVVNAPIFGGHLNISIPGGSLVDKLLDIVVISDIDWREIGAALQRLFTPSEAWINNGEETANRHPADLTNIPGLHHFRARGVTVTTPVDPRDATLDGEVRGQTPIYAYVASERLRVLAPTQS